MGKLLNKLRDGSIDHAVEAIDCGFVITRRGEGFDELVREAINNNNAEFVILPQPEGSGYARAVIIPLDA